MPDVRDILKAAARSKERRAIVEEAFPSEEAKADFERRWRAAFPAKED